MGIEIKKYPKHDAGTGQWHTGSVVAGNTVFCTGMDGTSPKTSKVTSKNIDEQTATALDKVRATLKEAGTSMDNIIRTIILLKNMEDCQAVREAERKYYQKHASLLLEEPPASKIIQYQNHVQPDALVEIDVTAVLSRNMSGWEVKNYPSRFTGFKQPYSASVVMGNLIFCSGIDGRNRETGKVSSSNIAGQMTATLDNLKDTLRQVGATMDKIVDTTILLTDLKNYAGMRQSEAEYYQSHARRLVDQPPASTFIKVASLATPECLVEIHATAVVSEDRPSWKVTKYPEWCAGKRMVIPYVPMGYPHLSKAVAVGDFIIGGGCSARTARGEDTIGTTITEQMKVSLNVIKDTIEDAGGSMENMIQTFILLKDIKDYPLMRQAELEYYRQHAPRLVTEPPVSTAIQPYSLARPDYLFEMDALSVITA